MILLEVAEEKINGKAGYQATRLPSYQAMTYYLASILINKYLMQLYIACLLLITFYHDPLCGVPLEGGRHSS